MHILLLTWLTLGLGFAPVVHAVVIDQDDRQPLPANHAAYRATGILKCRYGLAAWRQGTAQVTGSRSIITTAGHMFFSERGERMNFRECLFYSAASDQGIRANLSTVRIGDYRPNDSREDWAILGLDQPVSKDIKPYRIPDDELTLDPGTTLLQLTGYARGFATDKPHFNFCQVRDAYLYSVYPLLTDCDSGFGTSGSAQLVEMSNGWVLAALHVGDARRQEGGGYDPNGNFNTSTPVTGRFLTELKNFFDQTPTQP